MTKKIVKQLKEDVQDVIKNHPELKPVYVSEMPVRIEGAYVVRDDSGEAQEIFDIEVHIPEHYPFAFPRLVEKGGKIKRIPDRHIDKNGVACEENDRIKSIVAARGLSLVEYFHKYVHRFFCWQILFDEKRKDCLQGWKHGPDGIVEFYLEHLGLDDREMVKKCLYLVSENNLPGRNADCPCGSGRKLKRCHESKFADLKHHIGRQQLRKDLMLM